MGGSIYAIRQDWRECIPRSAFRISGGGRRTAAGFSLVEISLALLVVAIGMLAILSMFPAGLDQNARSISDTHAALFAEEVFSSLRVHAEANWPEIGVNINSLSPAASNNWYEPVGLSNKTDDVMRKNVYCHPVDSNIVNHSFRYRITLTTNEQKTIKSATLRVWPGEYGTTGNPAMFYSEFYQMNR